MVAEFSCAKLAYIFLFVFLVSVNFALQGCSSGGSTAASISSACEGWCEADQWTTENGQSHKDRHCGGDMSASCGSCPHCGGTSEELPCEGWCADDQWKTENGQSHKERHCGGDMSDLCGGCPHCGGNPAPTPSGGGSGPVPVPAPTGSGTTIRFMTYNVWWKNRQYSDLANMIQDTVNADIVSLQEAVSENAVGDGQGSMAQKIVDALNAKGSGRWAVANPWGSSYYWCGLQIYRSDRFDLDWHREIGHTQYHPDGRADARGICGALLRRKSDNVKACVWGTHPVPTGKADDANELISVGTSAMKECSDLGAPSVFMCDCNDWEENQGGKGDSVRNHLRSQTGLDYIYAHSWGIDHIFVDSSLGSPQGGTTVAPAQSGGGQPKSQWAGSDHAPVYVDIVPR